MWLIYLRYNVTDIIINKNCHAIINQFELIVYKTLYVVAKFGNQ